MIDEAIRRIERGEGQMGCPVCAVARRVKEEGLSRGEAERLLREAQGIASREDDPPVGMSGSIGILPGGFFARMLRRSRS